MKKLLSIFLSLTIIISIYPCALAHRYTLNNEYHIKYMDGSGDGRFNPDDHVSWSELCQIIYNLMSEKPDITNTLPNINDDAWYYTPINALYSAGLLDNLVFLPEQYIIRAEAVWLISQFYDITDCESDFTDVDKDYYYYKHISYASKMGWINGFDDGKFKPTAPITRAQLVTLLNRVLNRVADTEFIKTNDRVRIFTDVEPEHWAYYDIIEATVEHNHRNDNRETWLTYSWEPTGLAPGYYMINHYLYYVEPDTGQFSVNLARDGFAFNERGRYTTGSDELDSSLHAVVKSICVNEPKNEQNLEAVYFYVRDNFNYQARQHVPHGATGWELQYAEPMMRSHYGNCYSWAAVFMYLTRWVGYESRCQSGTTGKANNNHGWTEIPFDGQWYVFDPEMEHSSRKAGNPNYYKRYYKLPYNNPIRSYVTY